MCCCALPMFQWISTTRSYSHGECTTLMFGKLPSSMASNVHKYAPMEKRCWPQWATKPLCKCPHPERSTSLARSLDSCVVVVEWRPSCNVKLVIACVWMFLVRTVIYSCVISRAILPHMNCLSIVSGMTNRSFERKQASFEYIWTHGATKLIQPTEVRVYYGIRVVVNFSRVPFKFLSDKKLFTSYI